MRYAIGVDVGGTKVAYGLFDQDHKLIERTEHPTKLDGTAEDIVRPIVDEINQLTTKHQIAVEELTGVGLAFPSYIDFNQGKILKTSNIAPLHNFYARDYFEKYLKTRIVIDNDAHVAALAEHRFGAGRGFPHMLYCAVSTGISSGMIINNAPFRGSYGAAGESGHMLITPNKGVACGCGNPGCFMSYCSGSMIVKHIEQWLKQGETSLMLELANGDSSQINGRIIVEAARKQDPMALKAIDQMAHYLGVWLFNLYQIFNINCYVFGGGLVNFGEQLFGPVREVFDSFVVRQDDYPVYFKFAELGSDFGIIGAEQLLFDAG